MNEEQLQAFMDGVVKLGNDLGLSDQPGEVCAAMFACTARLARAMNMQQSEYDNLARGAWLAEESIASAE